MGDDELARYLGLPSELRLFDGLSRPYASTGKAKWYFLVWLFRDAPAQRLQPLLAHLQGEIEDSGGAERRFRREAERHSGMNPNTNGA